MLQTWKCLLCLKHELPFYKNWKYSKTHFSARALCMYFLPHNKVLKTQGITTWFQSQESITARNTKRPWFPFATWLRAWLGWGSQRSNQWVAQLTERRPWGQEEGLTEHPDLAVTFLTGEHRSILGTWVQVYEFFKLKVMELKPCSIFFLFLFLITT